MLSQQRILGLGVIEALIYRTDRNLLPAARVMAGLACLREAALVRIAVAVRAFAEWEPDIARLVVRSRGMALCACDLRMKPGERIAGFPVIELADVFPPCRVVTLLAVRPQASIVLVLVAGNAFGRDA